MILNKLCFSTCNLYDVTAKGFTDYVFKKCQEYNKDRIVQYFQKNLVSKNAKDWNKIDVKL